MRDENCWQAKKKKNQLIGKSGPACDQHGQRFECLSKFLNLCVNMIQIALRHDGFFITGNVLTSTSPLSNIYYQ